MTERPLVPLVSVHVVWHRALSVGEEVALAVVRGIFGDPEALTAHALRIPVRLWTTPSGSLSGPPPPFPDLETSSRSLVVVLVDDAFLASEGWPSYLAALADKCSTDGCRLLPVAISSEALELKGAVEELTWITPGPLDPIAPFILNCIVHELYVLFTSNRLKVFISHAKRDGEPIANEVSGFLRRHTKVNDWFDSRDIPYGSKWRIKIKDAATNLMLVVRSDAYASREWCRIEVLEAKRVGSPVVVLDALLAEEDRSFPYLGNVPAVRWSPGQNRAAWERLLSVILLEALRYVYFPLRVAYLCQLHNRPSPEITLARPPELLTLLAQRANSLQEQRTLVYPDPPLGAEETDIVQQFAPLLRPVTPTMLLTGS